MNIFQKPLYFEGLVQSSKINVICDSQAKFHIENRLITIIKKIVYFIFKDLFGFEARKQVNWAKGMIHVFDRLEQKSLRVSEARLKTYLKTAKIVKGILAQNKSPKVKAALNELKFRTTSIKYRLGVEYSDKYAKQPEVDASAYAKLKPLAEAWKKSQISFRSKKLSPKEINQLEILTQYPKIASLVLESKDIQEKFFSWALLEKNNVDAFVQFPRTVNKLIEIGLSRKIGRYGGQDLQIEEMTKNGKTYKDLTLPFEGKRESILNDKHKVTPACNYQLSIGEVFDIFKARVFKIGNLEYFGEGQGIRNWNANEWGVYNPEKNDYERIDLTDPNWIENMPYSEHITEKEAKKRFEDKDGNKLNFGPEDYIFTVVANNEFKHANMTGSHTMLCIALPLKDGQRKLNYMGKFPWDFADFEKEKKRYLRSGVDTLKGAIQCPDENFYRIERDVEGISYCVNKEQATVILNNIAKDKKKSEQGTFYFQLLIHNCTHWIFKKLDNLIPDVERNQIAALKVADAKPEGLAAYLVKLPKIVRNGILNFTTKIAGPIGQVKKRKDGTEKWYQLTPKNGPWNNFLLHPSMIILRKRERKKANMARRQALVRGR